MEELKIELNKRVTINNLCDADIVELSQRLDKKVVEQQKKMLKGAN
ncbi:MAG: aspartyl-phosphate phosphatase Spo0E family protein [Clostridium sp.]